MWQLNPALVSSRAALAPAAAAPSVFTTVTFDGTNDWLSMTSAAMSGLVDGKTGTFACRFQVAAAGEGTARDIFALNTARFLVQVRTTNAIRIEGQNSAATAILRDDSSAVTNATGFVTLIAAWDLAAGAWNYYLNDVSQGAASINTNDTIDYVGAGDHGIAALSTGSTKYNGDMQFIWFNPAYLDVSQQTNRDKFAAGAIGADGSGPTGSAPMVYFTGAASVWNAGTNLGTGGNFTMHGAVA